MRHELKTEKGQDKDGIANRKENGKQTVRKGIEKGRIRSYPSRNLSFVLFLSVCSPFAIHPFPILSLSSL